EDISNTVEEAYKRGKSHAIIGVAEGSKLSITEIARRLEDQDLGFTTRMTVLGHIQRGGKPTAFDRFLATRFGVKAVEFLRSGQTGVMTGLVGREIEPIPLTTVVSKKKPLPQEYSH